MTIYYVDPDASGLNNGTSWADAWTNVQSAFDTAVVSDTVYCRGTQILTVPIDIDTNEGTNEAGFLRFIGCNASGVNDGTRFVIDGNNVVTNCIQAAGRLDHIWIENFEVKRATNNGVDGGGIDNYYWVWVNCSFNNCGSYGVDGYRLNSTWWILCTFYNNNSGVMPDGSSRFLFCSMHSNTSIGAQGSYNVNGLYMGCIFADNGTQAIRRVSGNGLIYNCVIDNNRFKALELWHSTGPPGIIGNRITNTTDGSNDIGLEGTSDVGLFGWNYFEENDVDTVNCQFVHEILHNGVGTNVFNQADINQGYTSLTPGSKDYNLRSDATLRRTAISIPMS